MRHLLVLSEDVLPSQKFDCFAVSAFHCELILLILVELKTMLQSTVSDSCAREAGGGRADLRREKTKARLWSETLHLAGRMYVLYQCYINVDKQSILFKGVEDVRSKSKHCLLNTKNCNNKASSVSWEGTA